MSTPSQPFFLTRHLSSYVGKLRPNIIDFRGFYSMSQKKPTVFVIDVDGVMTDGQFYYTEQGKVMKVFGADDHDGLSLLKPHLQLQFVTGDKRGFDISKARIVHDMKMPLELVSTIKRIDWIKERWNPEEVIYMGDGIFDHYVFKHICYSIAPSNADDVAKAHADYVTKRSGGKPCRCGSITAYS